MRFVRFESAGSASYGLLDGESVVPVADRPWEKVVRTGEALPLGRVRLLAPCQPTKVVAVGQNYRAHAAEMGLPIPDAPIIFLKPPSSVIGPGEAIVCPRISQEVHHESELTIVIGRRARFVRPEDVSSVVWGYTCGNDVTARDLQRRDGQWTRSKSFDTFCPLGPWVDTALDVTDVPVLCRVNGQVRQNSRTGDMIFDVATLVAFVTEVMTLEPGDVIMTGTPQGVGPMGPGDTVEVETGGLGVLVNPVVAPM